MKTGRDLVAVVTFTGNIYPSFGSTTIPLGFLPVLISFLCVPSRARTPIPANAVVLVVLERTDV